MAERTAVMRPALRPGEGRRRAVDRAGAAVDRAWQSLAAGAVAVFCLLRLAFDAGGYFAPALLETGAVAFGAAAVLLALRQPREPLSTPALVALAALGGLAVWTGISSRWSALPAVALEDMQRALVYAGLFTLALLAAGSGRYSRHLAWAVLAVASVVVGAGLLSRIQPDWVQATDPGPLFRDVDRLSHPFTYWNALGALAAMGVVLGTGLAADRRAPLAARGAAAAAAVVMGVGGYLTFSRGAWLAFFAGLVVLLALSPRRVQLLASAAVIGLPLLAAVARLRSYPELTDPSANPGAAEAGDAFLGFLVTMAAIAAGAQIAAGLFLGRLADALAPVRGRLMAVTAGAVLVAAVGVYAVAASTVEGGTAQALADAEGWVDRQWDEFMTPTAFSAEGTERLTSARGTRSHVYGRAIDGFEAHPLRGDGSGAFEVRYAHHPDTRDKVRDAHSLYLETLGELGLVGVVLLLAFLGAVAYAIGRARVRRGSLSRGQAAAVGAAFAVWAVHAGVDWDWQVPGLTGTALVLAAAAFPVGRRQRPGGRRTYTAT